MPVSIIVPVLNECALIERSLRQLAALRAHGAEIIVVDGGSEDGTCAKVQRLADCVLSAPRGRASQMNAGARAASGDTLLFLHVDTELPPGADTAIKTALAQLGRVWGRFDVRLEPGIPLLVMVAQMMNLRSRLTGIATGDQAIFVQRSAFFAAGGYPEIPLMEDIALSKRLRRIGMPACLRACVSTSARRWSKHGVVRTILLMWWLRLAYFLGIEPRVLARWYDYVPRTP